MAANSPSSQLTPTASRSIARRERESLLIDAADRSRAPREKVLPEARKLEHNETS